MKVINKMIAIILLSGTGIGSVQAQDTTPQTWTLRQCIDYAIEHNIDIRQTANEAEQNKISVNTAKWARLPNLNGGVSQGWSWGRTASPKDNSYSDTNSSSTGVNLSTIMYLSSQAYNYPINIRLPSSIYRRLSRT